MRRAFTSLLVAALALLTLGADAGRARFEKLGHEMVCVCGCNQILLECNHVGCPSSEKMRQELMAGMDKSGNDNDVLQTFVAKYGPTVLAAPTLQGFNLAAWITPFAVTLAGLMLVFLVVRNWRFRPATAMPVSGAVRRFRDQARQETEL